MLRIPDRGRHITQEPASIALHLLGRPLATFRRRFLAHLLDLTLFGLVFAAVFMGLSLLNIHQSDPTLLPRLRDLVRDQAPADSLAGEMLVLDALSLVHERIPEASPPELITQVKERNLAGVKRESLDRDIVMGLSSRPTRLLRGRSPGKIPLGLRIVKLDGKALSWWGAFGRSAGYRASAATLLLGYLEAIWHPNRQAIHDRISGTVVVRDR